jgi:hypothetical protein
MIEHMDLNGNEDNYRMTWSQKLDSQDGLCHLCLPLSVRTLRPSNYILVCYFCRRTSEKLDHCYRTVAENAWNFSPNTPCVFWSCWDGMWRTMPSSGHESLDLRVLIRNWKHWLDLLIRIWKHRLGLLIRIWKHGLDILIRIWKHGLDLLIRIWKHGLDLLIRIWKHGLDLLIRIWKHRLGLLIWNWKHGFQARNKLPKWVLDCK